ncbi:hypothetical protein E0M25_02720 [Bacillus mycoides]|uniref:hypothetical protein n=1 Tax=Bacillus mycoides TaxID=1405 RepID=UPI00103C13D2|nr:hypothetical protein [Bacillus mycoides]TBX82492.1 hypothetical protein E0M25_02720 [Bacillus mycoides]
MIFILLTTKDVASNAYKPIFKIDKNGDIIFDGEGFFKTERKISNYKADSTTIPAFVLNTPTGTHSDVLEIHSGGSDRKVIGVGMHASGVLGLLNVGSLMMNGLVITFNTIDANSHLKYGTAGSPRTVPNIRTGTAAQTVNAEFIGKGYLDTTNKKAYKAFATGTGVNDWTALN